MRLFFQQPENGPESAARCQADATSKWIVWRDFNVHPGPSGSHCELAMKNALPSAKVYPTDVMVPRDAYEETELLHWKALKEQMVAGNPVAIEVKPGVWVDKPCHYWGTCHTWWGY